FLHAAWRLQDFPILPPSEDALYYSFDMGGYHFVALHTQERKDVVVEVDAAQLRWLERDLEQTTLPTIVFMHHSAAEQSLQGNRWFAGKPHICLVRQRRRLREIFERGKKVIAVFNGHLHWNHLDLVHQIPYVTIQSLIENLDEDAPGRPAAAHAIVRVSPKQLLIECRGAEHARYQLQRG